MLVIGSGGTTLHCLKEMTEGRGDHHSWPRGGGVNQERVNSMFNDMLCDL